LLRKPNINEELYEARNMRWSTLVRKCNEKETYVAPTLMAHGTIEEMTQANRDGEAVDLILTTNGMPLPPMS
jgi:hypothetical protein